MKIEFLYITTLCCMTFISSCSNSKFVVKKHNEFVIEFKNDGTRTYGGEYSYYKNPKNNFGMNKEILKLNKLIPNKNYDSTLFLFRIDYEYLEQMKNYIKKEKYKKNLITISETDFNNMKWYFDSIRMINR